VKIRNNRDDSERIETRTVINPRFVTEGHSLHRTYAISQHITTGSQSRSTSPIPMQEEFVVPLSEYIAAIQQARSDSPPDSPRTEGLIQQSRRTTTPSHPLPRNLSASIRSLHQRSSNQGSLVINATQIKYAPTRAAAAVPPPASDNCDPSVASPARPPLRQASDQSPGVVRPSDLTHNYNLS